MTYYVGLLLKDKTIIAADKRASGYQDGAIKVYNDLSKIGKISPYVYFSGAGNMNACREICQYFKKNNLEFPEDIAQVDLNEIKAIYDKWIQRAQEEIPNFEEEKETHGYLNLSMIVGGISKEKKPIMFFMNNVNEFNPQLIKGCLAGTATNMCSEANQMTTDFFTQVKENVIKLNNNPKLVITLLKKLFDGISKTDNSVSSIFDVMIVDSNGKDTLIGCN